MEEVNLDTSILINYIHSHLPVDKEYPDCVTVVSSDKSYCVIGGKVQDELKGLHDRRSDIYKDILEWYRKNTDKEIYEYDIASRNVRSSRNDKKHVYTVQMDLGGNSPEKILSELRRCTQAIDTLYREAIDLLDQRYDSFQNPELYSQLDYDLGHDRDVVVDAVEIQKKDDIDVLVSCDSDLHDNGNSINNTICSVENDDCTLTIMQPDKLSANL